MVKTSFCQGITKTLKLHIPGLTSINIHNREKRPASTIYYCTLGFGELTKDVIVKKCSMEDADKLSLEYETTCSIYNVFANDKHLGVPRALYFFKNESILVTEQIKGNSLRQILLTVARKNLWAKKNHIIESYCELAGKWLKKFHTINYREMTNFPDEEFIEGCETSLSEARSLGLKGVLATQIEELFRFRGQGGLNTRLAMALIHGDYQPNNMLISEGKFFVIDISGKKIGIVVKDIGAIISYFKTWNIKHRVNISASIIQACLERFYRGYFQDLDKVPRDVLKIITISGILQDMNRLLMRRWVLRPFLLRKYEELFDNCFE